MRCEVSYKLDNIYTKVNHPSYMYQSPLRTFRGHSLYDQHLNLAPTNKAKFAQNAKEEMFLIQILPGYSIYESFASLFIKLLEPLFLFSTPAAAIAVINFVWLDPSGPYLSPLCAVYLIFIVGPPLKLHSLFS